MKTVIMDIMKRSFTELSKESQIILGIIITIITIWEISAFLNMIERKRRWYLLSLAVGILIFSTILMQEPFILYVMLSQQCPWFSVDITLSRQVI